MMTKSFYILIALAFFIPRKASAQVSQYDVTWDTPGPGSEASMPLGNGDIGLNVWVDPGGDLLFYISKTDAWGGEKDAAADPWMQQGGVLMKLGLIRVHNADADISHFRQTLHLQEGEITIEEGKTGYRIWVDANHPVIRVEMSGPSDATVTLHDWRLNGLGDTLVPRGGNRIGSGADRIEWFHHNPGSGDPRLSDAHLADIAFGAAIEGQGLSRTSDSTLGGTLAGKAKVISIYPLTTSGGDWGSAIDKQVARLGRLDVAKTYKEHCEWWSKFWDRSYIYLHGDAAADSVTQGYMLQRFVTACAGRGAYPIKFNGSIFVVDNPEWKEHGQPAPRNADFRAWGGQYWFQNTRPMYWPRLAAGDFDMMLPLFEMYLRMLPGNEALVRKYYGHDGAYFQETAPFWGGLPFMGPDQQALYTHHYFTPILELSMMMLDYYAYTEDKKFLHTYLLPIAGAGLEFFDRHFPRDSAGRLLLDPDNSIEMFWKVHDPAPDIAGLHAVLPRMLELPVDEGLKGRWRKLLAILPPLPIDSTGTEPRLLPYTGEQTAKSHNEENPELYAIYPFRLYGLDKPGLELARHSFDIRKCPQKGCWSQDPMEAAMLGYTGIAKEDVRFNLTRKDAELKFPAFWASGHDYKPDEDNGGNGELGLEKMLLQTDGRKIMLLPAWPQGWDADFKLHAPYKTIIEGKVRDGKLVDLVVTPAERRNDIVGLPRHSATSRFTSYKGLVMAGYQGWFNAPGDGAGRGWNHYHAKGPLEDGNCKFDLWPDVSEYPKIYQSPFKHADGSPAYLFSSYDSSTTDVHFRWMRQYGIDGVFVQRFVGSVRSDPSRHDNNVVLEHCLNASRKYGRAIAVMYDLSGMRDSVDVDVVINDWKYLVDSMRLTSRGDDQTYLYHDGKPLVAVWGAGFGDHRPYTSRSVERILNFLQYDPVYGGCAILLGVPTYWRDQGSDADKDPHWMDLYKRVDIIQPWMVGRYHEDTYPPFKERIRDDIAWTKAHHEDYVPVVFPGFSWHNMYPSFPQNQIPRDSGKFFWEQITGDIQAGAQMLYVAMFDEIDEGTAIMKASLDPPVGKSTFVRFDPGIPNDYYLQLAGHAAKLLRREESFREDPPPPGDTTQQALYLDPKVPTAQRVTDLLRRMTLEEKVSQMMNRSAAIDRLHIPAYNWWNEGLHGVARTGKHATVFPQAIGNAATFDKEGVLDMAKMISTEARAIHHEYVREGQRDIYEGLTFWSPNINIFRDPRWGRGQETYGEDPYLTGQMGMALVRGFQGNDPRYLKITACAKHFAVHSGPESTRHTFDVRPSAYDLNDTYLPAFRNLIVDAKVASVMCAYNAFDGQPCCGSDTLMTDILYHKWKFRGYVTSDCGAIDDFYRGHKTSPDAPSADADAVIHGTDIECGSSYRFLVEAVHHHLLPESEIDTAVSHLLTIRFRLGMFDPPSMVPYAGIPMSEVQSPAHQAQALKMARESIVLLKNAGDLLPLDARAIHTIAVIGPNAADSEVVLGNYNGFPDHVVTVLEGIRGKLAHGTRLIYEKGIDCVKGDTTGIAGRVKGADVIVFVGGISPRLEGEEMPVKIEGFSGGDRTSIALPAIQTKLLQGLYATGKPVVFVMMTGSALSTEWESAHLPAIVDAWYGGEAAGTAVADVLFGDYNPAGRLPVTFYRSVAQLPDFSDYSMKGRTYRYFTGKPLYPFGYGLSYTRFRYSALAVPASVHTGSTMPLAVTVENTGKREGDEVVELYVRHLGIRGRAPIHALAGFTRVHLLPGEKQVVHFTLDARALSLVGADGRRTESAGAVEVFAGGGQPLAQSVAPGSVIHQIMNLKGATITLPQ